MSQFLTFFLLALLIPPLLRWLQKGSYKEAAKPSVDGSLVMRPSSKHIRFCLGLSAFGFAFGIFVFVVEYPDWQFGLSLGSLFPLFSSPILVTLRRRVIASQDSLIAVPPIGPQKHIAWADITSVTFRERGQTIRISTTADGTLAIPIYMSGLEDLEKELGRRLTSHVPNDAFAKLRGYLAAL